MATGRNRLMEITLSGDPHHNIVGSTIVSQNGTMVIIRRPESKPRSAKKASAAKKAKPANSNAKTQPSTFAHSPESVEALNG